MTPACTMALTEKAARSRAAGRCLLLPVCMVRRPTSGPSGITGTATPAERAMTGVALTSWNAERTDRRG
jgi:hypothetical protein